MLGMSAESNKKSPILVGSNILIKYKRNGFTKREERLTLRYITQLRHQQSKSEFLVVWLLMRSLALLILYTIPYSLFLTDPSSRVVPRRSFYDIFITIIHPYVRVKRNVIKMSYLPHLFGDRRCMDNIKQCINKDIEDISNFLSALSMGPCSVNFNSVRLK